MSLFSKNSTGDGNLQPPRTKFDVSAQMGEFVISQNTKQSVGFSPESILRDSYRITKDQVKMQKVIEKHESNRRNWLQTITNIKSLRKDKSSSRFSKDPSRTRFAEVSPLQLSLVERSSDFHYDNLGILR